MISSAILLLTPRNGWMDHTHLETLFSNNERMHFPISPWEPSQTTNHHKTRPTHSFTQNITKTDTHSSGSLSHSFEGILDLEQVTIRRENGNGSIVTHVYLKYPSRWRHTVINNIYVYIQFNSNVDGQSFFMTALQEGGFLTRVGRGNK